MDFGWSGGSAAHSEDVRTARQIVDLLHKHAFVGHVLRVSTLVEFDLDILLAVYFTREGSQRQIPSVNHPASNFRQKARVRSPDQSAETITFAR